MEADSPARPVRQHEHNLALVMRLAAAEGSSSRARLAEASGLTKSTVTQLTGELIEGGLLREIGTGRVSGPGRPANLLVLNSLGPAAIGLQIEADHVAGCLVDLTGRVRDRALRKADDLRGDPARAVRAAEPVLRRLLNTANSTDNVVAGVAVGLPGRIGGRPETATVSSAGLGWPETGLSRLLGARLDGLGGGSIPVTAHNSDRLGALAEEWSGGAGGVPLVYVGGEFGLGAGVLNEGVPLRGNNGAAGEIGHVRVRARGERCGCGRMGCLDTVAGQQAILTAAGTGRPASSRLTGGAGPLPALLAEGDRAALAAVRRAGTALGDVLGGLVPAVDPGLIVLGGRLAALGEPLTDAVRAALAKRSPALATELVVRVSAMPADIVARTAAATVTRELIRSPARWLAA
ncbi:transcriptional regulator [Prauserella marina]|uniref:Sugar kinase of the NBD/HSP70 family, may contain an N-terminal HTH domain n=1 Tax=Prauserella marina TaxID=530584 RepID=A0A222VS97_9PSEU|nr:ROK family transcriptional regulator [Prauserella marina]ASR36779.1 transcriptional regulator [Prauserella marina]PWV80325.1 putative NBD/HSP70 family sugar kinase [Prauserella marina]SDD51838.1 Sugar kinase of the NBD/HSP70 family, may contain an N-terminal HTH domain [Prauserella marina]